MDVSIEIYPAAEYPGIDEAFFAIGCLAYTKFRVSSLQSVIDRGVIFFDYAAKTSKTPFFSLLNLATAHLSRYDAFPDEPSDHLKAVVYATSAFNHCTADDKELSRRCLMLLGQASSRDPNFEPALPRCKAATSAFNLAVKFTSATKFDLT